MISASKTTFSLKNLKILRPKVTKNLTNLLKKFCEFPPRAFSQLQFSLKYAYIVYTDKQSMELYEIYRISPKHKLVISLLTRFKDSQVSTTNYIWNRRKNLTGLFYGDLFLKLDRL